MTRFALLTLFVPFITIAQDVPPPPKPDSPVSSLALTLESLKTILLASGRVETAWNVGNDRSHLWQQITRVVVEPASCQMREYHDWSYNSDDGPKEFGHSYFFESIDTVEALSLQEAHDRSREEVGQPRFLVYSGPAVYSLVINSHASTLLFSTQTQAAEAAGLMRSAAKNCQAMPVTLHAEVGAPTISETLNFIEQKLRDNGELSYTFSYTNIDGSPAGNHSITIRLRKATADPATCQVRFNQLTINPTPVVDLRTVLSFRRVEKLEVASDEDAVNRSRRPNSQVYSTKPVVYRVSVTCQGGDTLILLFSNEEIANRIAKAILHAVELCGGGSKEPF